MPCTTNNKSSCGGHAVSRAEFEENLTAKMQDRSFTADIGPLLVHGRTWDLDAMVQSVWNTLISRPPGVAGIEPSVGSVGDSYDNALAETVIGLFKTEVIRKRGPWKSLEAVEFAALEWVDCFNHRRLLEPIGNIPPAEHEALYYQQQSQFTMVA